MLAKLINTRNRKFQLPSLTYADLALTLAAAIISGLAGWLAFNLPLVWVQDYELPVERITMACVAALVIAWRMGVKGRWSAFLVLAAWYGGAGWGIAEAWQTFFAEDAGRLGWFAWMCLAASPALLFRYWAAFALMPSVFIVSITPLGMFTPVMAAMSFFPGWGGLGFIAAWAVLLLPLISFMPYAQKQNERIFVAVGVVLLFAGVISNLSYDKRRSDSLEISAQAWAMDTKYGGAPSNAFDGMVRRGQSSVRVQQALQDGAKLIVTPEATAYDWGIVDQAFWAKSAEFAKENGRTVLVGAYRKTPDGSWQDGLLDLATDAFYPATVTVPFSMWRPWSSNEQHFPLNMNAFERIPTAVGDAVYLICYEEVLVWPMAIRMIGPKPDLLITSANQWFVNERTRLPQERSIDLQKRLWGTPLLRAVNWPSDTPRIDNP